MLNTENIKNKEVINIYDGKSSGADSYRQLAQEVINRKDI